MTEYEAIAIRAAIIDLADSFDEHLTPDDVVAGLQDIIREIDMGEYSEPVIAPWSEQNDTFNPDHPTHSLEFYD